MKQVLEVIGKGAAQSWQMDNRGKTMIEGKFDYGFAVDWMRKDLGLALTEAKRNGARGPLQRAPAADGAAARRWRHRHPGALRHQGAADPAGVPQPSRVIRLEVSQRAPPACCTSA